MDLKRLISQLSYRIEPNPSGGFIARPTDPTLPAVEAPTRDELLKKLQQNTMALLAAELPGLRPQADGKAREISFHIEHKPEGGFAIHSTDPNTGVMHAADEHELQTEFLEKVLGFAATHLIPEASKALAAQMGSANVKVVVNRKTAFRLNSNPQGISFDASAGASLQSGSSETPQLSSPASVGGTIDAKPITPESSNAGKVFGLLLLLIVGLGAIYLLIHR